MIRVLSKIYRVIFEKNIKGKVHFTSIEAQKSFIVETGVKIYNPNIMIGKNVKLYHNVIIFGDGPVKIGDGSRIGYNTIIYASNGGGVSIGRNCAIAANAYIIDTNHSTGSIDIEYGMKNEDDVIKPVVIGDAVWIGAQCVISAGSNLANAVIVGANSFVNKSFPENAIIAGSPAKIIRYRGDEA